MTKLFIEIFNGRRIFIEIGNVLLWSRTDKRDRKESIQTLGEIRAVMRSSKEDHCRHRVDNVLEGVIEAA